MSRWVEWTAGIVLAGIAATAFLFTTFQTKSEASQSDKVLVSIDSRLQSIEEALRIKK